MCRFWELYSIFPFALGFCNITNLYDLHVQYAYIFLTVYFHVFKGHKVVTGSWTQHDALKVWDFRYNKVLQTLPFHIGDMGEGQTDEDTGAYIYNTQFADRNTVLAGGSGTRSLQAISLCDEKVRTYML